MPPTPSIFFESHQSARQRGRVAAETAQCLAKARASLEADKLHLQAVLEVIEHARTILAQTSPRPAAAPSVAEWRDAGVGSYRS